MAIQILVVEDEHLVRESVVSALQPVGYAVTSVATGEEGLSRALSGDFDLMVLDVGLPGIDGWEVVARMREAGVGIPVIFLTALAREEDVIRGLEKGGDDYITKPFSVRELTARVRVILRRRGWEASAVVSRDGLSLDRVSRVVTWEDASVRLTDQEARILATLMDRREGRLSRAELLEEGLGYEFDPGTKVLDVHLTSLRKKLRQLGIQPITNIRGEGYALRFD
jgi:two-component system OmpR family response regulator